MKCSSYRWRNLVSSTLMVSVGLIFTGWHGERNDYRWRNDAEALQKHFDKWFFIGDQWFRRASRWNVYEKAVQIDPPRDFFTGNRRIYNPTGEAKLCCRVWLKAFSGRFSGNCPNPGCYRWRNFVNVYPFSGKLDFSAVNRWRNQYRSFIAG